jgi:hypothetical protein
LKSPQPPNDYDGVIFTTNTLKMVRWGDFYQHIFINKNSKAKQSEWRKIIETQSEATRCASLCRFREIRFGNLYAC